MKKPRQNEVPRGLEISIRRILFILSFKQLLTYLPADFVALASKHDLFFLMGSALFAVGVILNLWTLKVLGIKGG